MNIYDFKVRSAKGVEVPMTGYKGKVLEILDFPCNQFGHQAPGTEEEIQEFCTLKYKTIFPLFAKIDVNGKDAEPLFEYLKKQKGGFLGDDILKLL